MKLKLNQRPYSEKFKAYAVRKYATNRYSVVALARRLGIARDTLRQWVREAGNPMRPLGRPATPETPAMLAQFKAMHDAGMGRDTIAAALKIGTKRVAEMRRRLSPPIEEVAKRRCEVCLAVYPMNQDCPNGHGRVA